jgi:hypothetical protein
MFNKLAVEIYNQHFFLNNKKGLPSHLLKAALFHSGAFKEKRWIQLWQIPKFQMRIDFSASQALQTRSTFLGPYVKQLHFGFFEWSVSSVSKACFFQDYGTGCSMPSSMGLTKQLNRTISTDWSIESQAYRAPLCATFLKWYYHPLFPLPCTHGAWQTQCIKQWWSRSRPRGYKGCTTQRWTPLLQNNAMDDVTASKQAARCRFRRRRLMNSWIIKGSY